MSDIPPVPGHSHRDRRDVIPFGPLGVLRVEPHQAVVASCQGEGDAPRSKLRGEGELGWGNGGEEGGRMGVRKVERRTDA